MYKNTAPKSLKDDAGGPIRTDDLADYKAGLAPNCNGMILIGDLQYKLLRKTVKELRQRALFREFRKLVCSTTSYGTVAQGENRE